MAFDQNTRNRLQRFVADARSLLADEFTRQLQATYGMNPKTGEVADIKSLSGLTPSQQETANLLRDTLAHYLASAEKGKEKARKAAAIERIVREQAFTVLNRLAALRMSEARGFLIESLAKGYESKGFQLFHRLAGSSLGETGEAYRHYLYSLFDEFSLDLAVLFDRFSVQGRLFPSTPILLKLLALINDEEIASLLAEDETIGWIYQYFNSIEERKKMRAESQAPRNSRELAVRNQFFTPRYVVEFLTDNTLGRIWYEMTQGETYLKQSCKYLVRRPNEVFLAQGEVAPEQKENVELSQEELLQQTVYIDHRALKDPRDIRMLDPACGSMHFGLYAFDLFEKIYSEAWDIETAQGTDALSRELGKTPITIKYKDKAAFLREVPRLIIENNIHGVDIDPRAAQIAGLSLWLRAHNSWQQAKITPQQRPKIQRSNIVCAEPMPGEKALLQEFTASLKPTVLGQLVEIIFEKMELAGEAGTLLKIEQEIQDAIAEAKQVWQKQNRALNQFPDLAKVAKQRGEIDFDVSDIDDEGFWQQAEHKILEALADYVKSATTEVSGQKRLFAEDAVKGFAFIELCRKRFDVILMNPPFGESSIKCIEYLDKNYRNYNKNILCSFIIRSLKSFSEDIAVGAIYDKTALIKSTYEGFRKEYLLSDSRLFAHIDLGWDVLDANVEVACSVFDTHQKYKREAFFVNVRDYNPNDKKQQIENSIETLFSSFLVKNSVLMDGKEFKSFPNAVLGYDFPPFARRAFKKMDRLDDFANLFEGHTLKSEVYFRYWWEVPEQEVISSQNKWQRVYNGGAYQRYVSPLCDVICRGINGEFIASHPSTVLRNNVLQGKGCIGFGKRGQFVDTHVVPNGFISTVEGKHIIVNRDISPFVILALLNSNVFQFLINLYCGQHKYPGYVSILPVPSLDVSKEMSLAGSVCEDIFKLTDSLQSGEEVSPKYGDVGYFNIWSKDCDFKIEQSITKLNDLEHKMNEYIFDSYKLSPSERNVVLSYCINEPTLGGWWESYSNYIMHMRWSFLFGLLFFRWDISKLETEHTKKIEYFSELPPTSPPFKQ